MIKAHPINPENLKQLRGIYGRFAETAVPEYQWAHEPLDFEAFSQAVLNGLLNGYWVEDTAQPEPIAFMLYRLESHRAIEFNVIYFECEDKKAFLDRLMRLFIADHRETSGWDVVSFAMLGKQEQLIRTLPWYGFKPVGQAILAFDMTDTLSVQILQQQTLPHPGEAYALEAWQPHYADGVAQCVYEAFSKAVDSLWDPRFRTEAGAREVVALLTSGIMGEFMPQCTSVLLKQGQPVGFCFLLQDTLTQGHIPLIGLHPDEKNKKLGNLLLKDCLMRTIQEMVAGHHSILKVNATTDTDNIRALKMYRRMGFREEANYPHVYLTREKLLAFQPGKWC